MSNIRSIMRLNEPHVVVLNKQPDKFVGDDALMGVEFELERIRQHPPNTENYFEVKTDGSLRNNGFEYVTYPMRAGFVTKAVDMLYSGGRWSETNISERCSVHVHVNCGDLTLPQLKNYMLLYQVLENVLFAYAGNDRDKNIFCVPWSHTTLNYGIVDKFASGPKFSSILRRWQKYTALNMIPLASLGTVEFRHMPGCADPERVKVWIKMLANMRNYAVVNDSDKLLDRLVSLNTTSAYGELLQNVFPDTHQELSTAVPMLQPIMEAGVVSLKYMLVSSTAEEAKRSPLEGAVDELQNIPVPRAFVDRWVADVQAEVAQVGRDRLRNALDAYDAQQPRDREGRVFVHGSDELTADNLMTWARTGEISSVYEDQNFPLHLDAIHARIAQLAGLANHEISFRHFSPFNGGRGEVYSLRSFVISGIVIDLVTYFYEDDDAEATVAFRNGSYMGVLPRF